MMFPDEPNKSGSDILQWLEELRLMFLAMQELPKWRIMGAMIFLGENVNKRLIDLGKRLEKGG